jgi:hypothetical protein
VRFTLEGRLLTVRVRRWPRGRREVRYRFARNISRRALWCLLEYPRGGDVAFANLR